MFLFLFVPWHDISSVQKIVVIVSKQVSFFRVNNTFKDFFSFVSFFLEASADYFSDLSDQSWESSENFVSKLISQTFKIQIHVLQAFHCWFSELVELWLKQVDEHIN